MKFSFEYDPIGELWQGFHKDTKYPWYDIGLLTIDWYRGKRKLTVYFWRFSINIIFGGVA